MTIRPHKPLCKPAAKDVELIRSHNTSNYIKREAIAWVCTAKNIGKSGATKLKIGPIVEMQMLNQPQLLLSC